MNDQPLSTFLPGTIVHVTDIEGGQQARARLLAMGLTPGCPVLIMEGGEGCPLRIRCRGSEVCLGFGLAEKVRGHLSDENDPCKPVCDCHQRNAKAS